MINQIRFGLAVLSVFLAAPIFAATSEPTPPLSKGDEPKILGISNKHLYITALNAGGERQTWRFDGNTAVPSMKPYELEPFQVPATRSTTNTVAEASVMSTEELRDSLIGLSKECSADIPAPSCARAKLEMIEGILTKVSERVVSASHMAPGEKKGAILNLKKMISFGLKIITGSYDPTAEPPASPTP